ncbi:MAG: hypothetical protein CVU73_15830 [Deltaproteobacteria bacterium HGW-Deltaproteobacteria-8]|jgi:hypothetical protein|nr:MAG: hypothetical protein CVU73_15830 [Deltaproteobacteria bacterium HGW-Deltaproteobacteria-8]
MNLDARINALTDALRQRATIPCALLGRMARSSECCSRGLAATIEEFQTCRACPEGQRLAASAPLWGYSKPLPALVVYTPPQAATVRQAKPASRPAPKARPVALPEPTCRKCGCTETRACPGGCWWVEPDLCSACAPKTSKAKAPRAKRQAKPAPVVEPVITTAPVQAPEAQLADPRLVKLASALRELTADGRMRVSMLDLMRAVGAANYDEAAGLVIHAGLRTSQLSGPVQTVLVDHTARQLMASAASEVRQ